MKTWFACIAIAGFSTPHLSYAVDRHYVGALEISPAAAIVSPIPGTRGLGVGGEWQLSQNVVATGALLGLSSDWDSGDVTLLTYQFASFEQRAWRLGLRLYSLKRSDTFYLGLNAGPAWSSAVLESPAMRSEYTAKTFWLAFQVGHRFIWDEGVYVRYGLSFEGAAYSRWESTPVDQKFSLQSLPGSKESLDSPLQVLLDLGIGWTF